MLKAVLDDMAAERAFPQAAPKPRAPASVAVSQPEAAGTERAFEQLLAERDAQIAELQEAVIELSGRQDGAEREHIARLEGKLAEQERTIRSTLTMLIEWIEGETEQREAA
jgi:hypothetical protein